MTTTPETRSRTPHGAPPHRDDPLWRELVGRRLRLLRVARGERIADVARRAGVAPQYLSEVERGRKDPSSEVLQAIVGALGVTLLDLTVGVARELHERGQIVELASITSIHAGGDRSPYGDAPSRQETMLALAA